MNPRLSTNSSAEHDGPPAHKRRNRTALVTGASGFVGRHLVQRLLAEGWSVKTAGRRPVSDATSHRKVDLAGEPVPRDLPEGIDTIFHLAAWQPDRSEHGKAWTINVDATTALAESAARHKVRRFIHLSSTAAMGNATGTPIDETTECRPSSIYEVTKREAEQRLLAMEGIEPVILRPPMIAGPGQTGGPLLKMLRLCQKERFPVFDGRVDMAKPLVHVNDLVEALHSATTRDVAHETFLITSGKAHRLGEILETCATLLQRREVTIRLPLAPMSFVAALSTPVFRAFGRESPLSSARLAMFLADRRMCIRKARRLLDYQPRVTDTHELLRSSFDWFVSSGQLVLARN